MGETHLYDLREARDTERGLRDVRWFMAGLGIVTSIEGGGVLLDVLLRAATLDAFSATAIGGGLGFGILGAVMQLSLGPGPASIEISQDEVVLRFSSRRVHRIRMTRPGDRLKLYVYPKTFPGGQPRSSPYQVIMRVFPIRNPLSFEAYAELLRWAKGRGLDIDDRPWYADGPLPTHTVVISVPAG